MWGYVKSKVYESASTSLVYLKQRIQEAFTDITPEMLGSVRQSCATRFEQCISEDGFQFEQQRQMRKLLTEDSS